jgi:8-hydroxy-5-deazaflavin:NADPH oxidoreductase
MKIAILGTGMVGQALAARAAGLGNDVVIGTRDPAATLARTDPGPMGDPPFHVWHEANPGFALTTLAEACVGADIVVNATSGGASVAALAQAGAENLDGSVILDVSNPLDFSAGFPPTLLVKDTDSLGEQIQRAFPSARVVKSLNTITAGVMIDPGAVGGGEHTVFVCGDDDAAKATVRGLLESFGWTDIVDLGDITAARGVEMYLPLWLRLMGSLGTAAFNLRIVR